MSDAASPRVWTCPSCGRRVPMRAPVCHCGMTQDRAREAAAAQAASPSRPGRDGAERGVPADVRVLLAAAAIAVVAGLGWAAFGPAPRDTTVPVLGYVDPAPADVAAARARAARRAEPPFRLPWWK